MAGRWPLFAIKIRNLASIVFSRGDRTMVWCSLIKVALGSSKNEWWVVKNNRLAVFATPLQCIAEVNAVSKGTLRHLMQSKAGIEHMEFAAERDGEMRERHPTVRKGKLLGFVQIPFGCPCQSEGKEESNRFE